MFSPSIRKHPEWSPVVAQLNSTRGMKETRLDGHDFALKVVDNRFYRLLLLSSSDLKGSEELRPRLERLNMLQGGQDVGIAFLLGPGGDITDMMELQNILCASKLDIQIIPITSPSGFLDAMNAFLDGVKYAAYWKEHHKPPHPLRDLIPYCTPEHNMAPHTANLLSDLCHGFSDLVEKQGSQDGAEYLLDHLGEGEGSEVIAFWRTKC